MARRLAAIVVALSWVWPWTAEASTRALPDEVLAARSVAAVHGVVAAIESRYDAAVDAIYTYVSLDVRQSWGRQPLPPRIVLKQLGGRIGDRELFVGGQATFAVGEEVFVFLEVRPRDGTLYVAGLDQGKWTIDAAARAGAATAARDLHGSPLRAARRADERTVDELEWLAHLSDRATPFTTVPAELFQPSAARPAWTFLSASMPARWFEAASALPVYVDSQSGGHPQMPGGGSAQLLNAVAMWRNTSSLNLLSGAERSARCFYNAEQDGRISVTYSDPCDEIDDGGSVLAIGGYSYGAGTQSVGSTTFRRIAKGMIVVDNNPAKFQFMSTGCYEQMLAHELGHAIGLGHSTLPDAIMYYMIRACQTRSTSNPLSNDELAALAVIYPRTSPGPQPPAEPELPAAPTGLTLSEAGGMLSASWQPSTGSVTEYIVEAGSASGASNFGRFSAGLQTSLSGLVGPGTYYVRVRARNASGEGPASNEASLVVGPPVPQPPSSLAAVVSGTTVSLSWAPPAGSAPAGYVVEAGSAPGLANLVKLGVSGTSLVVPGVAPGEYHVRVRAVGSGALSEPSNEVQIVVEPAALPAAPSNLVAQVSAGGTVALSWSAPGSGPAPEGYILEAGDASDAANLVVLPLGPTPALLTTAVLPGTYYVRVRAATAAGYSAPSNEVVVVVP